MNISPIERTQHVIIHVLLVLIIGQWGCNGAGTVRLKKIQEMRLDVQTWDCGDGGGNVTATLKDNGVFIVRGVGAMMDYNYTNIGHYPAPWYGIKDSITSVIIENGVTSVGNGAFFMCVGLTSVMIPSSVASIGKEAFRACSSLTVVMIADGVKSIGECAFYGCSGLTSVPMPSSVTTIGRSAFGDCIGLTTVTIHDGVTSIGETAFLRCYGLTSVTISGTVVSIGERAFSSCMGLSSIIVAPANAHYSSEDGVLFNKAKDTLILCPKSKQGAYAIPYGVKVLINSRYGGAFHHCVALTSVTIPSSVTTIGDYAFASCDGLTSVTIPNRVASIGESAFSHCKGLASLTIEDGVESIGHQMFYSCSNLTSVTIPSSVTFIGKDAFAWCEGLTSVTSLNFVPPKMANGAFNKISESACLYVQANSLTAYRDAEGWRDFKCIKPLATALDDG